jgi:hypothetical protein
MLSAFVNEHQNDWDEHLPYIAMAYRAAEHEKMGITPNYMMLGREAKIGLFPPLVSGNSQRMSIAMRSIGNPVSTICIGALFYSYLEASFVSRTNKLLHITLHPFANLANNTPV